VIPREELKYYDAVYFFVSHIHGDHFSRKIYSLANENPNTRYFIASDVTQNPRVSYTVFTPGRTYRDGFLFIRAGGSTDQGVCYLIEAAGQKLFHAGDLNCWHWSGEWSAEEENEARKFYDEELDKLAPYAQNINAAFLPVDPRMNGSYDDGAQIFVKKFHPQHVIPMHCWGNYSVTEKFRRELQHKNSDVFAYSRRGEWIEYRD